MKHVVMFSGGAGSWAAAKRVAQEHGTENLTLLFTDTKMEDEDLYRFLTEAASNIGAPLVTIADGRDPWQVFEDERFLGNSRIDPCSKILKRQLADKYLSEHFSPEDTTVYVGIDWSEIHRYERLAPRKLPWVYKAPLCEPPYLSKADMLSAMEAEGLKPPRLYAMGFPHNNCGGFCVKAGKTHFRRLFEVMPERFEYHADKEKAFREKLGKDVTILKDGLSLHDLKAEIVKAGNLFESHDWGGCGCFGGNADDEAS